MGSIRFWILLVVALVVVLAILAALGSATAATPVLRYVGWPCLAGIFVCIPPIVIKFFVATQQRIGNGDQSMVRTIQQYETGIVVGVWLMIGVALIMALPRIRSDILAEKSAAAPGASAAPASSLQSIALIASNSASVVQADSAGNGTTATDTTPVLTPGAGSKTRTAILDALRERLKMKGRFRVDHIRTYKTWAFVRATEVVELDKGELQETDLTVSALLELPATSPTGWWRIVELWTLPDEQQHSMADFLRAIRAKQRAERLPEALFPGDLE